MGKLKNILKLNRKTDKVIREGKINKMELIKAFKEIETVADYFEKNNANTLDIVDTIRTNLNFIKKEYQDLDDMYNLLMSGIMYYEEVLQKVQEYQQNIKNSLNTETNVTLYQAVAEFLKFKFDVDEQLKENL